MKTKYIIPIIASCLLMTGCSDFLSENPKSIYTQENAIVDEAGLKAVVTGTYNGLINLYVINTNTPIFLHMLGTDELCYRASNTNVRSIVDRYSYSPTEGCIGELWLRYYTIISRANVAIAAAHRLDDVSLSVRNECEGESRFMRAWSYFQLVQFFGELPLVVDPVEKFDYEVGRSSIKDVYELIVNDLDFAVKNGVLPLEIKDGHAGHWAAKTLLAKVYLTMASSKEAGKVAGYSGIEETSEQLYRKAYDLLEDIIDNSGRELLPVYSDVFKIDNKNVNKESIWEIQFSAQEPYGTQWAKELGLTNTGYSGTSGGWRYCALGGQCNLNTLPSFRNYYRSWTGDVRRVYNICDSIITYNKTTGVPVSIKTIVGLKGIPDKGDLHATLTDDTNKDLVTRTSATKYRWGDWKKDYPIPYMYSNCPNNIIALRYADVLLMFTEADMRLNGGKATQKGLDAVNAIVQRSRGLDAEGGRIPASKTPEMPDYTAQTLTFEALMKERACELCFEFWRRHDLARTGMFEHFLESRNASGVLETNFDPKKNYLLPVPQYEIDNTMNKEGMYQNPEY